MKKSKKILATVLLPVVLSQTLYAQSGGGFGGSSSSSPSSSSSSSSGSSGSSSSSSSDSFEVSKTSYSRSRVMSEGEAEGQKAAQTVIEKIGRFEGQRYAAISGLRSSLLEIINADNNSSGNSDINSVYRLSSRWSDTFSYGVSEGIKSARIKAIEDAAAEVQSEASKFALTLIKERFALATMNHTQPDSKIPAIQVPKIKKATPEQSTSTINQTINSNDAFRLDTQFAKPNGLEVYSFTLNQNFLKSDTYLTDTRNFYSSSWAFSEWRQANLNNSTSFYRKISNSSISENASSNASRFEESFKSAYDSRILSLSNKIIQSNSENQAARAMGQSAGENMARTIVKDAGKKEGFQKTYLGVYQAEMEKLFETPFRKQFALYLTKFQSEVIIGSDLKAELSFAASGGFPAPGVETQLKIDHISNIGKGTTVKLPIMTNLAFSQSPSLQIEKGLSESSVTFYVPGLGVVSDLKDLRLKANDENSSYLVEKNFEVTVTIQDQIRRFPVVINVESVTGALGSLKPNEAGFSESVRYISVLLSHEWHDGSIGSTAQKFKKEAYSKINGNETPIFARVINKIRSLPAAQKQQAKTVMVALAGRVFGKGGDPTKTSTASKLSPIAGRTEKANQQDFLKMIQGL